MATSGSDGVLMFSRVTIVIPISCCEPAPSKGVTLDVGHNNSNEIMHVGAMVAKVGFLHGYR